MTFNVTYRAQDDIEETLTATGGHPFYVVGQNEFVFVSQLSKGDVLSLPAGRTATVVAIASQSAPVGETFTTYNFEVAEHHIYFAGVAGVWVHNSGLLCDALELLYNVHRREGLSHEKALAKLEAVIAKRVENGSLAASEAQKHLDDLAKLVGEAPEDTYNFALGLTQHPAHGRNKSGLLFRFSDKIDDLNVKHYWDLISKKGLPNAPVGAQLEKQLLEFMAEAKRIHFNLDGVVDVLDANKLKRVLELGADGTERTGNITRWEFLQVWSKFKNKTTFYHGGKDVTEVVLSIIK